MRAAKLLMLRMKRRGLMRERARLHQQAQGIQWLLAENQKDAMALERQIADLEAVDRITSFQERYKVRP